MIIRGQTQLTDTEAGAASDAGDTLTDDDKLK